MPGFCFDSASFAVVAETGVAVWSYFVVVVVAAVAETSY